MLILTAAVLIVAYGYRPTPALTEFAAVKPGPMRVTIEEEGKTRVINRYVVSAPVAGFARRVRLKVGDTISPGQLLLELEPLRAQVLDTRSRAEGEARVAAAEAAVRAAEQRAQAVVADDQYWDAQLARVERLLKSGDIARENYDKTVSESRRVKATRQSADHAVEQARHELEAARAALRYSAASPAARNPGETVAVHAPVAGRVLKVIHESEGVVTAGQSLLEIGNARSLEVEVEVLSADAVRILPGSRVLFERWGGDQPLEGRVRRIEPVAFTKVSALGVEEQRVLVVVDLTSPPEQWARLGDGYRVEASFVLWESDRVLLAPASALFRFRDGWAVFRVENQVARRRVVEVGHRNGQVAEILSGLKEGEMVVVRPDDSIEDGRAVRSR